MSSDIDGVMNKLAQDMQTAIPTDYQLNANANVTGGMTDAAFTAAGGGPLVMVQQMIVRSEDDIAGFLRNFIISCRSAPAHRAGSSQRKEVGAWAFNTTELLLNP